MTFHRSMISTAALLASIAAATAGCGRAVDAEKTEKIAALQARIAELQTEAARVEDVTQIHRLQRMYGYYVDNAQWDAVADLFAENGTIEIGLDGVYVGKERVREYLYALGGGQAGLKQGQLNEHMQLQPVVTVAPDGLTAKGRWRALILAGQHREYASWGEGPYENQYVKEDGVWKIGKLHWYETFMVPYDGGWVKNEDATGGVYASTKLPPDRPPSEHYEVWPGVYTPPMHFEHPVTGAAASAATSIAGVGAGQDADEGIAMLAATVADLERRVQRLRDIAEIENLVSIYGYYLDKQLWDQFADLFAEDGTMEISQRGVYVGKQSIRKALHLFGPQGIEPNHLHNHIQLQPLITVAPDGKRAWVRSRVFSQLGTYGTFGSWSGQVYENELVKENGVWKFKADHAYTTYFGEYEGGWAHRARPAPKPSDKIPPDRPPTQAYEAYPGVFIPPYHYDHPVTGEKISVPAVSLGGRE